MARKPIEITEERRRQISVMAACGLRDDEIAMVMGVSESYLSKNHRPDLKKGRVQAIATVGQKAYQMAISGEFPAMTMFFLKCRAGWREVPKTYEEEDDQPVTKVEIVVRKPKDVAE